MDEYEPTPLRAQRTLTTDDTTFASNPGRLPVNYQRWARSFPARTVLPVIAGVALWCWFVFGVDRPLWFLGIPMSAALAWNLIRVREHFLWGCANPAVVVSQRPPLVAVQTNLSNTGGFGPDYLVIKILRQPLGTLRGGVPAVGTRLATVALYVHGGATGRWTDFNPVVTNLVTDDETALARVLRSIPPGDWAELEAGLAQVPTPYRPGLYPVTLPPS